MLTRDFRPSDKSYVDKIQRKIKFYEQNHKDLIDDIHIRSFTDLLGRLPST